MLLDLRVMLAACVVAVVLLIGGFGMLAAVRTPGKPSVAIPRDPSEVTGSIAASEKAQILTDEDKAAQPASQIAPKPPAPEPVREAKAETPEKAVAPKVTEPAPPRAAARPKPRAPAAARQESGANFRANNPLAFPFFGLGTNTSQ